MCLLRCCVCATRRPFAKAAAIFQARLPWRNVPPSAVVGCRTVKLDPIALSIPAFFILIGVELLWARLTKRAVYRFNDSINDLACGVLSQVLGLFAAAILLGNYIFVFDHARLADPGHRLHPSGIRRHTPGIRRWIPQKCQRDL